MPRNQTDLPEAIKQLASLARAIPDGELDRPWRWRDYDSEGVRFAFFRTYEELRELAVKLRQERVASGPPLSSAQLILSEYHAAYNDLQAACLGIEAEVAERAPGEKEWSLRRTSGHILGADLGFYVVVRYALDGHRLDDGRPAKISDETWDAVAGIDEDAYRTLMAGTFENLQAYHHTLHERVLREFADVQEDELEKPSMFWEEEPMTLRFRLHRFDSHMRQHTIQIDKTLGRLNYPPSEAKRLIRLIYAAIAQVESSLIGAWEIGENSRRELARMVESRREEIAGILR